MAQKLFGTKEEALAFADAHLNAAGSGQPQFEFQGKTYPVKIKSPQEAQQLLGKIRDLQSQLSEGDLNNLRRASGLTENVLTDSTGSTLQHILDTFKRDVRDFKETGEVSDELHNALYDYYFDDMPYGTKKARDGDPYEWVADRFGADLGIDGYGSNSPGIPDSDYSMERESVGDYADEYQDSLAGMLKIAGVPAQARPAPQYDHSDMEEGILGTVGGGLAGLALGGPLGAIAGAGLGQAATDGGSSLIEKDEEGTFPNGAWKPNGQAALGGAATGSLIAGPAGAVAGGVLGAMADENDIVQNSKKLTDGWKGTLAGSAAGGIAGDMAGTAIGPVAGAALGGAVGGLPGAIAGGAMGAVAGGPIGGAIGGLAGGKIGDKLGGESTNEESTTATVVKGAAKAATQGLGDLVSGSGKEIAKNMLASETIDPNNPRDYERPTVQRQAQGQAPLTANDIEQKDRKAEFDYYQRAHGKPHPDSATEESRSPLAGQYGHAGKMKEVSKDTSFLDRLKELSGMKK